MDLGFSVTFYGYIFACFTLLSLFDQYMNVSVFDQSMDLK